MTLSTRALAVAVGVAAALPLAGCSSKPDAVWPATPGPKVVVSFAPLYCFAVNVAGPDAHVKVLMGTTGPHHFQPTDTDARTVRQADLFFVNGLDLDSKVAATIQKNSGNAKLKLVALGDKLPKDMLHEGVCTHADHDHGDHEHPTDPHVWLGPDHAVLMVEAIRDELKAADPAHADGYDARAAAYVARLKQLKADGVAAFADKTERRFITFHDSLGYFTRAFGVKVADVVQKKPGVEPTADEMRGVIKACKTKQVRLLAIEPQYGANTSAASILTELRRDPALADAAVVEIDPLETVKPDDLTADWYEKKMRANIEALSKAMK